MFSAAGVAAAILLAASPSPSPSPTPAPTLEGITLGDDPASVLRRFDVNPNTPTLPGDANGDLKIQTFDSTTDFAMITIYFDTRVRLVSVLAPERTTASADPFGVAFGDSPDRVQQRRGKPDDVTTDGALIYEPDGRVQWVYQFQDGKLNLISVDDLHPR
jgi:hypothetical protein